MSDISPPKYEQQSYYSPYPPSPTQSYPGDGSQAPNYQGSQGPYAPPPQGYYPPQQQQQPQTIIIQQQPQPSVDKGEELCVGCAVGATLCMLFDMCLM
ncbi:hypothetical protein K7432_008071 [Basidiobolus ranarum]|uniref:Cysteine-rich transmembrane CYSTM domain-containing protein n=1 Tax=Basidiobolus ranarum TaxID=34480 RepID=A0ABR2W035_9FUNG